MTRDGLRELARAAAKKLRSVDPFADDWQLCDAVLDAVEAGEGSRRREALRHARRQRAGQMVALARAKGTGGAER